jgi:hypothetical protein
LDRPSVVQVQLCASPVSTPGRLLISTRNRPAGESTSASTSLTLPSSSMNSKFVQTCQESRSGRWLRSQSSASRSHAKLDSAMTCQRAALRVMDVDLGGFWQVLKEFAHLAAKRRHSVRSNRRQIDPRGGLFVERDVIVLRLSPVSLRTTSEMRSLSRPIRVERLQRIMRTEATR